MNAVERDFARLWWRLHTRPYQLVGEEDLPCLTLEWYSWNLRTTKGIVVARSPRIYKNWSKTWASAWETASLFALLWHESPMPMSRPYLPPAGTDRVVLATMQGEPYQPLIRIRRP